MSQAAGKVRCNTHGLQDEAFVCEHIVNSLHTGHPVGFHWPSESDQPRPDAWCSDCEEASVSAGGDWTEQVMKVVNINILCGACYDHAKGIWEAGRKVAQ
jgi:hypothetical protein